MKLFFLLILTLTFGTCDSLFAQTNELIQYDFEQVDSLFSQEERPLAIFIHTDWCRYCKNMEQTTFRKKRVLQALNNDFYFISFDAEKEQRTITFRGYPFTYRPNGRNSGVHTLAEALGTIDGELTYPAFVVLNKNYEIIFQYNEFLDGEKMSWVLSRISKHKSKI